MSELQTDASLGQFQWRNSDYRKAQRERYWQRRFPDNWKEKMHESEERKRVAKEQKKQRQDERTRKYQEQMRDARLKENERKKEEAHQRRLLGLKKSDRPVMLDKPLTRLELMSAISARLVQPDIEDVTFNNLAQLLARLKGWTDKKSDPDPEPKPKPPAPVTDEIQQILEAEEQQRKKHGT